MQLKIKGFDSVVLDKSVCDTYSFITALNAHFWLKGHIPVYGNICFKAPQGPSDMQQKIYSVTRQKAFIIYAEASQHLKD